MPIFNIFTLIQGLLNFSDFQKVDTVSLFDQTVHIFFEKLLFRAIKLVNAAVFATNATVDFLQNLVNSIS